MKLKLVVLVVLFFGIGIYTFFQMTEPTVEAAVSKTIIESEYERSNDSFELVEVPDSNYYLAIYNEPNQILVLESKDLWGRYNTSVDSGMNLYAHTRKGSDHFMNDKLKYGTVEIPEGKTAFIEGKPVSILGLGRYFSETKFYADYKDLYFYHLETPKKIKAGAFDTIVEVQ
ncbi:hypothetical protein [Pseudalkalibacillus salsuginis]|uniref:hypothetical protein n=1 Tax=Pseudalkalibacillus salsuginis TaxID=2910972 RepID=UPI001F1A88AD|nr:hypothetical protein [Pseudalkalibacillus salsuginis]MCF6409421.1 hypothetical protein [Pseudalkalibacillus salsuginis]